MKKALIVATAALLIAGCAAMKSYSSNRNGNPYDAAVYDRALLVPGNEIAGPAIVEQVDTTVLIETGWHGTVAPDGTLLLTTGLLTTGLLTTG